MVTRTRSFPRCFNPGDQQYPKWRNRALLILGYSIGLGLLRSSWHQSLWPWLS